MAFDRARIAFGPEALSRFTQIIEEVAADLVGDGCPAGLVRSNEMRTRLAQKLLGFARFWWTDTQIKQLLLRTLRNEVSASRKYATAAGAEARAEKLKQNTGGWWAIRFAYLGVDKSQAIWRKSVRAPGPRASSAEAREPSAREAVGLLTGSEAVGLLTGSDDTVLDDVSV